MKTINNDGSTLETRVQSPWTFEIRATPDLTHDTCNEHLGYFTDTVDRKTQIYVNRDTKKLHRPGKKPTPIKAHIYWDVYTGGRSVGEVPFWVAEDFTEHATVENIVGTFKRAESMGSEWCMMDYEIRAIVNGVYLESIHFSLPSDADAVDTEENITAMIDNLRGIVHEMMQRYEAAFALIKESHNG